MKKVTLFLVLFITFYSYSQLEYIHISDISFKQDTLLKCKLLPNLNIKIDSTNSIFLDNKCIYKPNKNTLVHYETYNKEYLFITILEEKWLSVSIPLFIPRKRIYIVKFSNPEYIFDADFNEIRIAKNKDEISKITNMKSQNFYYIVGLNEQKIFLLSNNNDFKEIFLAKKQNTFLVE